MSVIDFEVKFGVISKAWETNFCYKNLISKTKSLSIFSLKISILAEKSDCLIIALLSVVLILSI